MERGLLVVALLSGCNWVFGIGETDIRVALDAAPRPDADPRVDLDRDGTKDVEDTCIAPDTDLLIDSDYDGVTNDTDPCPFDAAAQLDGDGDGIGDDCDPFPRFAGDRVRCLMAFSDPELSVAMWRNREEPPGWQLYYPRVLTSSPGGSMVTEWVVEAPAPAITTFHANIRAFPQHGSLFTYARAVPEGGADVGCGVRVVTSGWQLVSTSGLAKASAFVSSQQGGVVYTLTTTFEPGKAADMNLHCTARFPGHAPVVLDDTITLPAGSLGFSAGSYASIQGLVIYERDAAP